MSVDEAGELHGQMPEKHEPGETDALQLIELMAEDFLDEHYTAKHETQAQEIDHFWTLSKGLHNAVERAIAKLYLRRTQGALAWQSPDFPAEEIPANDPVVKSWP